MLLKRMVRILVRTAVALCLGLALLVGTSGYWLPWAVPGLLRLVGGDVDSVRRGEDGGLVLQGVRYRNAAVDLSLAEMRSPMPLSLFWNGLHRRSDASGEVRLSGLEVRLKQADGRDETESPPPGPEEVFGTVERSLALADRWLPPVALERVAVVPPGGETPYVLPAALFRDRQLDLEIEARAELPASSMKVVFSANDLWHWRAEIRAWALVLDGSLDRSAAGPRMQGNIARASGSGSYFLDWEEDAWIPSTAALKLANFRVPEGIAGLPAGIEPVGVDSLELDWDGTGYALVTRVRGGRAGEELTLDLSLGGDFESVVVRTFEARGSWVRLTLGDPVRLDLETLEPEAPFRFSAFADLGRQEFYPVRGELNGTVEADVGPGGSYPVLFALTGRNLEADGRFLRSLKLQGSLDFPVLVVDSLRVDFPEGSVVEAEGSANLGERTLSVRAQADLEAADLDVWAGGSIGLEGRLRLEASAVGPWERPSHRGSARIGKLTPPGVVPLAIELDWEGEGTDRLTTGLTADTGEESVRLRSGWIREGSVLRARLEELKWAIADQTFLALGDPADVRLDLEVSDQWPWTGLSVGNVRLTGDGRELGVQWDPPETASLRLAELRATDFSGWLPPETSLPDVSLETVSLEVGDFDPVLIAEASVRGSWRPDAGKPPIRASVQGRLDEAGVDLTEIHAAYGGTSLLAGQIGLPITLHPWSRVPAGAEPLPDGGEEGADAPEASAVVAEKMPLWRLLPGGDLRGSLSGDWSADLRELIHDWGGPFLEDADLELVLGGTVQSPEARLSIDLDSMSLEEEWVGADFPRIRNLQLKLVINPEKILLNKGLLELRDSGIRLTGELPYPEILREFREGNDPDVWKVLGFLRADAELRNWDAAVWQDRMPILFRPQGKITGAVGVDPGLVARGEVEVSGFSLRPTLYSPTVDDIHATLRFEDRLVRLKDAGASVGGGSLSVSGTVDLEEWTDPRYTIKITGNNVPVARTPDMILRSDADLTFALAPGEKTPLLQGELRLRNSTFLIDFDPFAPNIETGPGSRPPYFSVEEKPFADWRCDLTIEGQDFLRVRSSIFSTELSASLRLTRTLGQPLLLGSIRANGGRIRFPGMGMRIESAEAFITPEQPNLLQIEADAIGQNRTYVVTMNASGSAEDPQIEFSSTPTLSNAQIIRLLATGSLDGGGAGAIGLYLGQALLGPGTGEGTLADRLSVEIGQEVTESGRSTVEVIYRINDRWSVEGEYDRFDTYNLNLVRILLER